MKYQLVLQWSSAIRTFDEILAAEDALTNDMGDLALVDGHDTGSGELNIFLLTDNPELTFEEAKRILTRKDLVAGLRAAFRERTGQHYQIIWPPGLTSFSVA
jgi:hypothetical protein